MRGNAHVRFGGRAGETDRLRGRHRAPARPYLSGEALDTLRRQEWQRLRRKDPERAVWLKGTRWALRRRPEDLLPTEQASLALLEQENADLYRGYLLHDQLRAVYSVQDPA